MKEKASWIYYPADFEIMLMNRVNMRRRDRELIMPPIWHTGEIYKCVKFARKFILKRRETVEIYADGEYNIELDTPGNYLHDTGHALVLEKGEHSLTITVYNEKALPCLYVSGESIVSDSDWYCTAFDGRWVAASKSSFYFHSVTPNDFKLKSKRCKPVSQEKRREGILYDFGRETFGKTVFRGVNGADGLLRVYYGESEREALDTEYCETLDVLKIQKSSIVRSEARGFRYIFVISENATYERIECESEYAPLYESTSFRCDNELLTKIWNVSLHTMRLTTHEFFIDGIKRDRWVWMGDSAQSIMMNWYCFYDTEIAQRTLIAFGGKGEVTQYLNTINDYTLYWFSAIADYYRHTGDIAFLKEIYPRVLAHIDFCVSRLDSEGLMVGKEGDWVFVDWGEGLTKEGALSFLQILLWRAFRIVAEISAILGDEKNEKEYSSSADCLFNVINDKFWNEECGAFIWSSCDERIFRQPNIMAIMTGFANDGQKEKISALLHNEECPKISTPYMRFYELAVLAELGDTEYVLHEILDYWGGMLLKGATSFWEKYDPSEDEISCLAMYGRKYGKSLCHAWGAAPLYLIGRYLLGLEITASGESFVFRPRTDLLGNFCVRLPLKRGEVFVEYQGGRIRVRSSEEEGELCTSDGKKYNIKGGQEILLEYQKRGL